MMNEERLEATLDRTIGFIEHCDTKVSYILSILGVMMTILVTMKTPKFKTLETMTQTGIGFWDIVAIFTLIISAISFFYGLYCLTHAVIARTENQSLPSKIFFGDISSFPCYHKYIEAVNDLNYDYKADLLSQIYQNSKICSLKFSYYNKGFKFSCYSLPFLMVSWLSLF